MTFYWLIKSEPAAWSWQDQQAHHTTRWDGVRNYQANNNLKQMRLNDLCFFYHSVTEKKIMGIVRVVKTYYPDPSDSTGVFGSVDVAYERALTNPVSLTTIKASPPLQHLALVRQSRLSVIPIDHSSWELILKLGQ